ncbi:MAG TPA: O-antigen ligase family protein, partial [Thermoanaerobaculia bacterium]|nr:O-antigen ligase family protein [Thermoanaerobaculia bacterium]
ATAASAALSAVSRAGMVGVLLLPAFLGLPGAVARCWRGEVERRVGLRALAGVVAAVSLWALLDRFVLGAPRAAMPLGHHNLLAACLVPLLPLALLPVRERGAGRFLGMAAGGLGVVAVVASGSLTGAAGVGVAALVLAGPAVQRRGWLWIIPIAILALLLTLQAPRLLRILRGEDTSARARAVYFEAGREGFLARPFLGQGPGSVPWTASLFLDPAPGVNPWGEAVGELHSLPVQIAYELGACGLLLTLGLAGLFAARRLGEVRTMAGLGDAGLVRAALGGLAGGAVALLGTAALPVLALPLSLALAAGAALAGRGWETLEAGSRAVARGYVVVAALALAPLLAAHALYERALAAELAGRRAVARERLAEAVRLDPAFPLYRMRLALLHETGEPARRAAAEMARRAAEDGHGVEVLWTVAGILGQVADRPWAPAALQTACALDPLSPLPPWFGMLADPAAAAASRRGAHAVLADPRLAAAILWEDHPTLLPRVLGEVERWPGIDPVWRRNLLETVPSPLGAAGGREWLALSLDVDPRESVSLFTFRRRPWPAQWPVVALGSLALDHLHSAPATSSPVTPEEAFDPAVCTVGSSGASNPARVLQTH